MMQKINKRCSNKNTFIHKLPDKIPEIVRNISVCYNSFIKNITILSRTSINMFALNMADNLNIKDYLKQFLLELLVMCTQQYYFFNRFITDCNKVNAIVMMLWEFIFFRSAYHHRPIIILRSFLLENGTLVDAYNCIIYIYEVHFYSLLSSLLLDGYQGKIEDTRDIHYSFKFIRKIVAWK